MRRQTRNYLIWAAILLVVGVLIVLGFVELAQIEIEIEKK